MRALFVALGMIFLSADDGKAWAQAVVINEIHYDNVGTDADEGVEIAGPVGTNLTGYTMLFYNGGSGTVYLTVALSGIIPDQNYTGFGALWFGISGIQNDTEGMALVKTSGPVVVQRLAYEGSFTAVGGTANGQVLPNIGVSEPTNTPLGQSLQLSGTGTTAGEFTWVGPAAHSRGEINAGQIFGAPPLVSLFSLGQGLINEGDHTLATLTLSPAPESPQWIFLSSTPAGIAALPTKVLVPVTGVTTFLISALSDNTPDGFQEAILMATPSGAYPPAAAALQVVDADRPARSAPGVLRVATFNVKVGIGAPGSAAFAAVREVIERVNPDILLMQEVSEAGEFGDARALLEQAGFLLDPAHLATAGDAFIGQAYSSGDFGTGECILTASRYPIATAIQIGRGVQGRKELTRFSLFTTIDLPGPDLEVVNVHLKAGTTDADCFRKALECYRIREFIAQRGLNAATDHLIVGGDCNAIDFGFQPTASYNTASSRGGFLDGSKLPVTFLLGEDLISSPGVTLPYRLFPHQGFNPAGLFAPSLSQADGVSNNTFNLSEARYDYFFLPQHLLVTGNARGEVYNSRLEPQADGLPKRPTLPAPELSEVASDHYLTFLDFNLTPTPALTLSISPSSRDETSIAAPPLATVSLNPPPPGPVQVSLRPWRGNRVQFTPDQVTLTPSQPSVIVSLTVPFSPLVEASQILSLSAVANGYSTAYANFTVHSAQSSGSLVFSQYLEPTSTTAPPNNNTSRALEIYNASGQTLDMARLQWLVQRYTNGSKVPTILGQVKPDSIYPNTNNALLLPGKVLVIGEAAIGEALVTAGLLPAPISPTPSFTNAASGTLYCKTGSNAATLEVVFLKGANMDFNGDDALEIIADGVLCDTFGVVGQDPGTAWSGGPGTPSSADQNLTLRPEISTGSSGFTLPSTRFSTATAGNTLTGIGIPPFLTDRYATWATAHHLTSLSRAPNSDPDQDGRLNLIEFLEETDPNHGDSAFGPNTTTYPNAVSGSFLTLAPDPWLSIHWEHSDGLSNTWAAAPEVIGALEIGTKTRTRWQWSVNPASITRQFWRYRASRP